MCDLCAKVAVKGPSDPKALLEEVGKAIAAGTSPEHFTKALDVLLGTTLPPRDEYVEAIWEDNHRNRETD